MTDPKQISVITARKIAYAWKASVTRNAGMSMSQKRISAFIVAWFLALGTAFAQGTVMPDPVFTGLDGSGNPIVSGKLCTYVAGTSTPATTYTTSALSPLAVNTNPVILNAAGRATVFLRPGSSYKFVLYTAGSDTTCNTGTLVWSADNIQAVPSSNVNVDVDGTAGESLAAGEIVYLSDGSGAKNAGQWYKADADLSYASLSPQVGFATAVIATGDTGSIRISGRVTGLTSLSVGSSYYVSTTAGEMTTSPPANVRRLGQSDSATSIVISPNPPINGILDPTQKSIVNGRCTLTSDTPVTTADVTGATTVYFTPYLGNYITLYTGATWAGLTFAQYSIAVPATTSTMYDVFLDYNDGTPQLALTAWTNDTTRATALTTQDGVYVKSGDTQQRYLCSMRTTGVSGQTEDSAAKRYLWNYYNRVRRSLRIVDATNSWTYSTAAFRQANGSAANQVDVVVGVAESLVSLTVHGMAANDTFTSRVAVAIGEDSTTAAASAQVMASGDQGTTTAIGMATARLDRYPAVGRHFYAWLEYAATGGGVTTWYGDNGVTFTQTGISGFIE